MDETDKILQEIEQDHYKYIKEYKNKINTYLMQIKNGNADINVYGSLFNDSHFLYIFTKDDKGGPRVSKKTIDDAANQLFILAEKNLEHEDSYVRAQAYAYLATIYHYREDNNKALECYNKAVEEDSSFLLERGSFKNVKLKDRAGALADFNQALAQAKDQDQIELINMHISNIDLLRDTDKLLSESKWLNVKFFIIIGAVVLYICYVLYDSIKPIFH